MPSPDAKTRSPRGTPSALQLGLRANWQQFTLLVIVNAFVGGMVGLERSIVPLLGQRVFGLASTTAVLSFIVSFGVVKAASNLFAGRLSDRIGRKGVLWWLIFELVLTNITNHAPSPFSLSFGRFLSSFPLDALFGVLIGAISIQWQAWHAAEAE